MSRRPGRLALAALYAGVLRVWLFALAVALVPAAHAQVLSLDALPDGSLGRLAGVLVEGGRVLSAGEALERQRGGAFAPGDASALKFGIGARPVWLHLEIDNRGPQPRTLIMQAGVPWIDRIDVHLLRDGRVVDAWSAGDADARWRRPEGSMGYVFELDFAPGVSEILLRAETLDPMVLPVRLLSPERATMVTRVHDYGYGLLYGFLFALMAYNAMLYAGLRDRSHLDYALYLICFALLSLAYSGHGYAWFWPGQVALQRYVILILMVLVGCAGLRFASGFLRLAETAPRADRVARWMSFAGLAAVGAAVMLQDQAGAALVAFVFVLLFSVYMVMLGVLCVRRRQVAAPYFLVGALFAMAGAASTALGVWSGLPFNRFSFHAAELGFMVEGTLLALALAYRMRRIQSARVQAEQLSRTDPLTGLLNRRAFLEQAAGPWSTALRKDRPLSVIVFDLDHFKTINDTFGHATGDDALCESARVLERNCRRGDLAARWGGEEFILLLPETDAVQARAMAERLLGEIRAIQVGEGGMMQRLSASLGVAERGRHGALEDLIRDADAWMYRAKAGGRGRVLGAAPSAHDIPATAFD